jgi:hypothetical protein
MNVDPSTLGSESMAGQRATKAAAHAGTWSTFLVGGVALIAGIALALKLTAARSR